MYAVRRLFDMGGEYYCYAADITVCYPVSGRFSDGQRFVYETVLAANRAVLHAVRPGVAWPDMHLLAERTILEALKARGCLTGAQCTFTAYTYIFTCQTHDFLRQLSHLARPSRPAT